jgi:hypothetical protein
MVAAENGEREKQANRLPDVSLRDIGQHQLALA